MRTSGAVCFLPKLQLFLGVILVVSPQIISAVAAVPESAQPLVSLQDVDPTIRLDLRYFTGHNFVGRPIKGYAHAKCLLTKPAAEALRDVQQDLKDYGISLKVYDCFRPQRAVDDFVAWAKDTADIRMKKEFYPNVDKSNLFKDGYIAEKSGHSRGSTMDLTIIEMAGPAQTRFAKGDALIECTRPQAQRFKDDSIDMGTGFDCFDPLAHTANPAVGAVQRRNRLLLKTVMEKHGFKNLPEEWWHYTLKDEPFPNRYFDLSIE